MILDAILIKVTYIPDMLEKSFEPQSFGYGMSENKCSMKKYLHCPLLGKSFPIRNGKIVSFLESVVIYIIQTLDTN